MKVYGRGWGYECRPINIEIVADSLKLIARSYSSFPVPSRERCLDLNIGNRCGCDSVRCLHCSSGLGSVLLIDVKLDDAGAVHIENQYLDAPKPLPFLDDVVAYWRSRRQLDRVLAAFGLFATPGGEA